MVDDSLMPLDFMIAPMRDESGGIRYLIPSAVEITERKKFEQSLRISEERFRVALSSVPIFVYNMDTSLRYTWVHNPMLNWSAEDLLGKTDAQIFPPETARELTAEKKAVLTSGHGMQREYMITLNNEVMHFLVSHNPIFDAAGRVVGLVGSAYNVTRQRQIEAQQREYSTHMEVQRRLSEYREKERQGIARDIHDGPIQTLVSTIFNVQAAIDFQQNDEARTELEQVRDSVKNAVRELRETINELRPPLLIRFGLSRAIRVHSEDFRNSQPGTALELDLYEDGNLLPEEVCLALYRIYQESLNNVVRHAGASTVRVRLARQDNHLTLEISDNGSGFSEAANLAQLIHEGHYGLAGMKERAEGVGGRFEINSRPNEGTRICVLVNL
jgi:PAS domain S-box-containing protein